MNETDFLNLDEILASAGVEVTETPQQPDTSAVAPQPNTAAAPQQYAPQQTEQPAYTDYNEVLANEQPQQSEAYSQNVGAPTSSPNLPPEVLQVLQQNQALIAQQFTAMQERDARVAALEAKLAAAEQHQPKQPEKNWYDLVDAPELTEEQRKTYEASLPVINAIAARQVREALRIYDDNRVNPLSSRIDSSLPVVEENLNAQRQQLAQAMGQTIHQTVTSRLPWLADAQRTREYENFYNAVIPNSGGLRRADLVEQALAAGNADVIVDVLSAFKPPAQQSAAQFVAPGRSNTIPPNTVAAAAQRGKRAFHISVYNKAVDDYANGKLTAEQFDKVAQQWNAAVLDGTAVV